MKVLNFGSLNYDYVYDVDHIVQPGETLDSLNMGTFFGGKGLNQSVAMARAGVHVYHAGMVGEDGDAFYELCRENGVDTTYLRKIDGRNGHAIIQVNREAQNCIIIYGGSNRRITKEFVDEVLADFGEGDIIMLQNEINCLDYIIDRAYEKKMTVILNPSPYDSALDAAGNCETNHMSGDEKAAERSAGISRLGFCPQYRFQGGIRYYWTVTAVADDGDEGIGETAWCEGGWRRNSGPGGKNLQRRVSGKPSLRGIFSCGERPNRRRCAL